MISGMSRRLHNTIWEAQCPELFGVNGNKPVQVFIPDGGIPVISMAGQRQDLAEQPGKTTGTASLKGILSFLQPLNCQRVKNHFGIGYCQHIVQKTGVVVVRMGQEDIPDILRPDSVLRQLSLKAAESALIARIDQDIPSITGNEVIVDNTIPQIADFHFLSPIHMITVKIPSVAAVNVFRTASAGIASLSFSYKAACTLSIKDSVIYFTDGTCRNTAWQ